MKNILTIIMSCLMITVFTSCGESLGVLPDAGQLVDGGEGEKEILYIKKDVPLTPSGLNEWSPQISKAIASFSAYAQPAANVLTEYEDIALNVEGCFSEPIVLSKSTGPYLHDVKLGQAKWDIIYVDDDDANGDGSKDSPYANLADAVEAATSRDSAVIIAVAEGEYEQAELKIGGGIFLVGGFDAQTWTRGEEEMVSKIIMTEGALQVVVGKENYATVIDGFTIEGAWTGDIVDTVYLNGYSKLVLRHNTIYSAMGDVNWRTYGDTHYGNAVNGYDAYLQAYHNRFLVPSETPDHVISKAIFLTDSCHLIARNHFVSFRDSTVTRRTQGSLVGNLIEDGYNAIKTAEEKINIHNNTIGLQAHGHGCGYAVYMDESQPLINNNLFVLEGGSAKGVDEAGESSDPSSFKDNHFILLDVLPPRRGAHTMYIDNDQKVEGRFDHWLADIDEINSLADISVSGNTVEYLGHEDVLAD